LGGLEGENSAKGDEYHDGGKGLGVVDAGTLTDTLGHEPGFEVIDIAIGIRLDFENLFVANGVTTKRVIGYAEGALVMKRSELRQKGD
jgi:hypothetical protein